MRNRRWLTLLGVLVGLTALLFIAAACDDDDDDDNGTPPEATATQPADGDGDGDGGSVGVSLKDDFTVTPSVGSIAAGTVTFDVSNDGPSLIHNFLVVRSDLAIDALPTDGPVVNEADVDVRGSTADLSAGGTETLEVDLEAGSYILICNVPGHYAGGMRVAFTVE